MPTAARPRPTPPSTPPGRADPARPLLPRTGVVLIASPRACRALAAMIASLEGGSPVIAGWIDSTDSDPAAPESEWSLPRLGTIADLPTLVVRLALKCAVVCAGPEQVARIRRATGGTRMDIRVVPPIEDLLGEGGAAPAVIPPATLPHEPTRESLDRGPAAPRAEGAGGAETRFTSPTTIDLGALIGRTPHALDREAVSRILTGKRILITGAGGSIGAELARVAAGFAPERLILMERAENALFEIDRQMRERHPSMGRKAVLHDVTDAEGTRRLLAELRPQVVFHAAAHKHVPLMEDHPGHAITNNLFGTKSIADAAVACRAERFVMISSDKAVNPTSVMGATKRLAELYVRGLGARAAEHGTRLSKVRYVNVLGSACSVLTIWSSQIAEFLAAGGGVGGVGAGAAAGTPITITDPRMTRYFMTIPEAATLVVQSMVVAPAAPASGQAGQRGEAAVGVFVLDMGAPIPIVDLACRFVRAHGLWPRGEGLPTPPPGAPAIDVVFTGARPGEKLHEELAYAAEALRPTSHPGVRTWAGPGFDAADVAKVQEMVAELGAARFDHDAPAILAAIRRHVPEMRSTPR